ncbi:hypothetical protein BGZ94_010033, partial [Podila epigama]
MTVGDTSPPMSMMTFHSERSGESNFEQSSVLGFSDLTSEALDSIGDSEDLDVWSQDDDECSLSTPSFRRRRSRRSSEPISSTELSPSTSLSHLPRPSFAAVLNSSSRDANTSTRFVNQMPLHDGSGNFARNQSPQRLSSYESSGHESDHSITDSIVSGASSMLRRFESKTDVARRLRISSSEFASVVQNIARLQEIHPNNLNSAPGAAAGVAAVATSGSTHGSTPTRHSFGHQTFGAEQDNRVISLCLSPPAQRVAVSSSAARSRLYDAEDLELMEMEVNGSSKISWLEALEYALQTFSSSNDGGGIDITFGESNTNNAVKGWTMYISQNNGEQNMSLDKTLVDKKNAEEQDLENKARLDGVKQHMALASLETLRRLQMRKSLHSSSPNVPLGYTIHPLTSSLSDPMQIDFVPTVVGHPSNKRVVRNHQRRRDSTLLSVFMTTLRRLRDHVKSNLIYHDYLENEDDMEASRFDSDENGVFSRRLGFEGDLGIEWATGGGGGSTEISYSSHNRDERWSRHHELESNSRRTSLSSASSSTGRAPNIRRVSSDCGLESMKNCNSSSMAWS